MRSLRIDEHSPYQQLVGVGGLGTGMLFALEGDHTLGRNESRAGRLLDVRDYCKLHIVIHYVAKLLGARCSGLPFHVVPVGNVGGDPAGKYVLEQMRDTGIDTSHVRAIPATPTLFSVCFQYPDGTGGNITTSNSAAGAQALRARMMNTAWVISSAWCRLPVNRNAAEYTRLTCRATSEVKAASEFRPTNSASSCWSSSSGIYR